MDGYEIFAYGNVDTLSGLFNGIAALMNAAGFKGALALVIIIGFICALAAMALANNRLHGPKWLLSIMLINAILVVPTSTVHIVDKTGTQAPVVIDNVSWGIASLASLVSDVGNVLTELFETAFQNLPSALGTSVAVLPADLTYQKTGLMFGSRLIKESRGAVYADPAFRADITNFIANCTIYDISQGYIPAKDFVSSTNVWALMDNTNPARYTQLTVEDGSVDSFPCPQAYAKLSALEPANTKNLLATLGLKLNNGLAGVFQSNDAATVAQTIETFSDQMNAAYARARIGEASADAAALIRQNALINAVRDAGVVLSQRTNDPSAMMLAMGKAQAAASFNAQYGTSGKMAEDTLPLLRNSVEALCYALFPFVMLMAMLFGELQALQLLKSYVLALIWVALWPPIYAVLNYVAGTVAAKNMAAAGYAGGVQGLTLLSADSIYQNGVSELSMVGYLATAVPLIASAVVFGMNRLANVGIGAMGAASAAAGAGAARAGDLSGNVSLDQQQLAPNRSDAYMSTASTMLGTTTTNLRSGDFRFTENVGSSRLALGSSGEIASRLGTMSANTASEASSLEKRATESWDSAFASAVSHARTHGATSAGSEGIAGSVGSGRDAQMSAAVKATDQLKHELGIKDDETAARVLSAALTGGMTAGVSMAQSALGGRLGGSLGANASARGTQTSTSGISESVNKAMATAQEAGVTDTRKLVESYTRSDEFRHSSSAGEESASRLEASRREAIGYSEASARKYEEAHRYEESAAKVKSAALSGKLDWTPEFHRFLAQNHVQPGSLSGQEIQEWGNRFFAAGGVGPAGPDGQPSFLLFDGMGPDAKTPAISAGTNNPNLLRGTYEAGKPELDGRTVDAGAVAADYAGHRAGVEATEVRGYADPASDLARLRTLDDQGRERAKAEIEHMREEGAQSRVEGQARIDEAGAHVSPYNVDLGNQRTVDAVGGMVTTEGVKKTIENENAAKVSAAAEEWTKQMEGSPAVEAAKKAEETRAKERGEEK